MRKLLSLSLAVLFAGVLPACEQQPTTPDAMASHGSPSPPSANNMVPPDDVVWGAEMRWEMLTPRIVHDEPSHESHAPLYAVGQIGITGDEHGTGSSHDHSVPVPPENEGQYSAIWHIYMVLPAPDAPAGEVATNGDEVFGLGPLASHANVDDDPGLEPLTSAERVEKAESMGLVTLFDLQYDFLCPVRPER